MLLNFKISTNSIYFYSNPKTLSILSSEKSQKVKEKIIIGAILILKKLLKNIICIMFKNTKYNYYIAHMQLMHTHTHAHMQLFCLLIL